MGKRLRFGDDGSITLETVIAFPIVMTLVLLIINTALWYQARSTALAAAQEGVRAGRAFHAGPQTASTTALSFARTTGNGFLLSPHADTGGSTPTTIVVHIHGSAVSLIPGLHLDINQVARGPIERFTSPINQSGRGG
jgi:Flp pilus assembly protein TadG